MRIGMMTDLYKPHVSGITNHIALNKKVMEAAGHEVLVFTLGDEDFIDDETGVIRSPGLPVEGIVPAEGVQFNLRYHRRAQRLLYSMDVVHVHHPFISGSMALRYCKPRGIPIVFTNHTRYDLYYQVYFSWIPEILGETAMRAYLPAFCRSIDLVIAPSAGMKKVMLEFGINSGIEVIPNGVDLAPIQSARMADRSEFGLDDQAVVLLFVGRLGVEKNLSFLLRAFSGLVSAYPDMDVHLLLVGDGPERDNLADLARHMGIAQRVHFAGLVPYERLPNYLRMSDAFVTASVTEAHPLTVIEAMAAGLPVLGIDSPGVGDTIVDSETGLLANEDLAGFTAKMVRMVTETELRRQLGENAREASEQFAIERTSQVLLDAYERLVDKSQGRKRTIQTRVTRMLDRIIR